MASLSGHFCECGDPVLTRRCDLTPSSPRTRGSNNPPSYNPDFNRLNARVSARLKALALSFLVYSVARTAAGG
ncbi:hypothetical protein D9M68_314010 [compost metagenome]